jgi:hypothetical protein
MNFIYWLLCLLIGLLPAWLVYRNDRKKNIPVKWLPALLRFATFFLTAALLLAPAFPTQKTEEEKPLLIWLQDNSSSINKALGNNAPAYRTKVNDLWEKWKEEYTVIPIAFGSELNRDSVFNYNQRSTNIANALQSATTQYQDQNIGAVILSSDGIYNEGLDPLYVPLGNAIPVYTIGLGDSTRPRDVGITRVYANKTVALNADFEIIADLRAEKYAGLGTSVAIEHRGKQIAQSPAKIDRDRFTASFRFQVKASEKGFQRYSVVVPPIAGEQNTANNRMDFFVEVLEDQTRVLIMAAAPHPDIAAIREALESVPQYKTEVRFGNDLPADLNAYAMIIAHRLPALTGGMPPVKNTPVWYILGSQSNLNVFSQQQPLLRVSGGGGSLNDVLPLLNNSYSYFTLPENIRDVLAKMPPLQVPYGNYAATGGQVLLRQQIGNVPTEYPLWILQTGDQPGAVLCGEGLWRWRLYEYKHYGKHDVVDELIRQTVSLLCVKKDNRPFRIFMDKYIFSDNEAINIYGELRNDNGELVNGPDAKLVLSDSGGKALNYTLERNGNSYRLNLGLRSPGNYSFKGSTQYNGKSYTAEGSFIVESVPLEELRTNADFELLSGLARQSGGSFFTYNNMVSLTDSLKNNAVIRPVIHTDKTYTQLIDSKWVFFLILLLAASEWLLRKYWSV